MKVLELFSGTECMSNAFRQRGHHCFTVDWDNKFPSSLHIDILDLTADMILQTFGRPDIIWSANDCSCFSVAAIGFHRRKNRWTGVLEPKTEKARKADKVNRHTLNLIKELAPRFFFIENPVGGLRKMDYMWGIPRYTVTYCRYGFRYRKATDIFTNHPCPQFLPPCHNGDPCHEPAPRGSRTGVQGIESSEERAVYPPLFCSHIVDICERYFSSTPKPTVFGRTVTQTELF